MGTHPNQTRKVYLGSEILLITLFFLLLAFSSLLWGGEKSVFFPFILLHHFLPKTRLQLISDFNLYQTQAPAFCYCFDSDLCFPNILSSPPWDYDALGPPWLTANAADQWTAYVGSS